MATKIGLFVTLGVALVGLTQAQVYESVVVGHLPTARTYVSTVYDGQDSIFIIGGQTEHDDGRREFHDDVYKFNVDSGALSRVGDILPDLVLSATGTDGAGNFFILGGQSSRGQQSKVHRFTSENPQPVEIGNLPYSESLHATACDGLGAIFILGGYDWPVDVLRYDTATGNTTIVGALPKPLTSSTAVFVGGSAYTFGGLSPDIDRMRDIMKFTPEDGTSELLSVTLPIGAQYASAVAAGTDVYIAGGNYEYLLKKFRLFKFDTLTQSVTELKVGNMPQLLYGAAGVHVEKLNRIYLFGGTTHTEAEFYYETDEIRYIQL